LVAGLTPADRSQVDRFTRPDTQQISMSDLPLTSLVDMWHQLAGLKLLVCKLKLLPRNYLQNNRRLLTDFSNNDEGQKKEKEENKILTVPSRHSRDSHPHLCNTWNR